jgi:hypothetical protein
VQVVVAVRRDGPVVQAGARRDGLAVQHVGKGRPARFAVEREVGDAEPARRPPPMFDLSWNLSEVSLPPQPSSAV